MTATYDKIKTAAHEVSLAFVRDKRTSNGAEFVKLADGSPKWMQDLCFAAHADGAMLPDDWRYEFIESACDALSDHDDEDDARDSIEPDIYNGELCAWLASNLNRMGYCDEAIEEYGEFKSIASLMAFGQLSEKREVFEQVLSFLREHVESQDDESDE